MANSIILSLFLVTLAMIVWNKIPRSIIAMTGALILVLISEQFSMLTEAEALQAIDFNTIGLLMGMMILVAIVKRTGILTYTAIVTAKASRGNLFLLMTLLGFVTAILSMLLDNVTTLVIIGPTTILIADILGVSALPFLIVEVVFSNIGGAATLIGDPPNIMIGSAAGFTFNDFLIHMFPVVMITLLVLIIFIRWLFRHDFKKVEDNFDAILKLDERKALQGKRGVKRSLFSLALVLVLFILHGKLHFHPAFIALLGASFAMLLVRPDPDEIFGEVEWDVLFFFASLFVIVKVADTTGIFTFVAEKITLLAETQFTLCTVVLLWATTICSTFIGSIAFTAAAIPVLQDLALMPEQVETLWWTLALGAGLGGNGLPISSAAGVLCLAILKKAERPLTTKQWIKSATILTFVSLLCGTLIVIFLAPIFF